jgi:RNA polymerase sigma factor (sigma-70 family)
MEADLSQDVAALGDGDLLRAFVDRADAAAFAELVARHGPLVLGACRRVLTDAQDAEDAFQAAFLVLARKAGTVRQPERLGAWLYGVALRCAFRVRKATRRAQEQPMPELAAPAPPDPHWADVRQVLDTEIGRLPAKLRTALILCELEGLDRATVADRLGVPIGTVSSRLSRAKDRLRRRLVRRGITLTLAALGLCLTQAVAEAATVPPPLVAGTAAAGVRFATGTIIGKPAVIAIQVIRAARRKLAVDATAITLLIISLVGVCFLIGRVFLWPEDDSKRIQGNWQVLSFRFNGTEMMNVPGLAGQTATATFDAESFQLFQMEFRYELIPGQSPKAINMEIPRQDGRMQMTPGVYEFDGDLLTIHLARPPQLRPTAVRPIDESQSVVIVLRRVPNK